jgi:hypothetical protein
MLNFYILLYIDVVDIAKSIEKICAGLPPGIVTMEGNMR